jgi:hypothetical protein
MAKGIAKEAELLKQAEAIFGKELAADFLERVKWILPIASYDFITDKAYVTSTNLLLPGKWCNPHPLFDIGGVSATGSNGKRVLRLRDFSCISQIVFEHPANVVATPRSSEPFFLTLNHALVASDPNNPNLNDVEITVFSWNADGKAAPNIAFDWRCRVPYWELIL